MAKSVLDEVVVDGEVWVIGTKADHMSGWPTRSPEMLWHVAPIVGPMATLALHHLAALVADEPDIVRVPVAELSISLGAFPRDSQNSQKGTGWVLLGRALDRAVRFGYLRVERTQFGQEVLAIPDRVRPRVHNHCAELVPGSVNGIGPVIRYLAGL